MGIVTRRESLSLLATLAGAAATLATERTRIFPSELARLPDPTSELPLLRVTSPKYESHLPLGSNRAVFRRGGGLIFSGERGEKPGLFRVDLKSGEIRQFAEFDDLDLRWFSLFPDERNCCCWSGDKLLSVSVGNGKSREIYQCAEGWSHAPGLSLSEEGLYAAVVERKGESHRLRLVTTVKGTASTVVEFSGPLEGVAIRAKRAGLVYVRGQEIWLASFDAKQNYRLKTVGGEARAPQWSPDGRSIFYLSKTSAGRVEIREFVPDTNEERTISPTTQFVGFSRNADASVFVGASGSKAGPHVLLALRSVRRELTLGEHKSSDPQGVAPVFSTNSQRVFFETDREGKPAIYSMAVDRLVEETEDPPQ